MRYIFPRISFWFFKRHLRRHVERGGKIVPILVTSGGTIVDGNRRIRACKELGIPIPVVYFSGLFYEECDSEDL